MSIADEARRLELQVKSGDLDPEDAEHRMIQFAEGALTCVGAADLVSGVWRARRQYPMTEMREIAPHGEPDRG